MSYLNYGGIYETPPGYCKYGKREFVGYETSHLMEKVPFITFQVEEETVEAARDRINDLIANYVNGAIGNIHWRQGIHFYINKENQKACANARLVVHLYTPPHFTAKP